MKVATQLDVEMYYRTRGISRETFERFGAEPGLDRQSIRLREGSSGSVFRVFGDPDVRWKATGKRECTVIRGTGGARAVYVVEGAHDLMSLLECGVKDAVAIPGAAMVKGLPDVIRASWKAPCEIRLLLDRDDAGNKATKAIIDQFSSPFSPFALSDVRSAIIGECKDVNDALVRDRVGLAQRLGVGSVPDAAMVLPSSADEPPPWLDVDATAPENQTLVVADPNRETLREALDALYETFTRPKDASRSFGSGIESLDNILRIEPGHLVIVAGRPAMGKTALGFQIALDVSKTKRVLYVSLEMSVTELLKRAIVSTSDLVSKDFDDPPLSDNKLRLLRTACDGLAIRKLEILSQGIETISKLQSVVRDAVKHEPVGLVVVDYIQLMSCGGGEKTREREVAEVSRGLKLLARELNCPVFGLSQLNRGVEQRQDKRPYMSDLRESGALEQDADSIILLYRDEYYNPDTCSLGIAELSIAKNRHGPTGLIQLAFDSGKTKFSVIDKKVPF